jgi:protein ImuA
MRYETLREQIIALELGRSERQLLPLGLSAIDGALQGGLDLGAIHEVTGPAAVFFTQLIMRHKGGGAFWLTTRSPNEEYYPPGMAQYGGRPEDFIAICLPDTRDLLKVAYEVLAANVAGCVLLEVPKPLTQTQMRKLQIAVQNTDTLGLVTRLAHAGMASPEQEGSCGSAITRWYVTVVDWSHEKTQIELYLVKNRRGSPCRWIVEIDHATHDLHLVSVS